MALIKSTLIASISGSLAGSTFARNRGGLYVRSRAVPVNPGTEFQAIVREALGTLAARWRNTLTAAQRAAWDNYALNTPRNNALGDPINIGGIGAYIRGNVVRAQAGLAYVDDGPTLPGVPEVGTISVASRLGASYTINYDDTLPWTSEDGAALCIYMSNNQSPARNFFKGPYRFAGAIAGNSGTPPTSPDPVTFPYQNTPVVGNRVFLRAVVVDAEGRLSEPASAVYLNA